MVKHSLKQRKRAFGEVALSDQPLNSPVISWQSTSVPEEARAVH